MLSVFLYNVFFTAAHFRLGGRLHFSFYFLTAAIKFSCFSSNEIGLRCFFIPCSYSSLSVFHVNVDSKINLGPLHETGYWDEFRLGHGFM